MSEAANLPELTRTGRLRVGAGRIKGRESLDWRSSNFLAALLLGIDTEIEDKIVGHIPANTPLDLEQAARAVGMRIKRARRLMTDPKFAAELEKATVAYRHFLEPGSIAVARKIRDDETQEPRERLRAAAFLRGPKPATGVTVNVQQNNSGSPQLAGYIIKLTGPEKVIEHQVETPIVPAKGSGNVDDQAADLKAERAEAFAFRPR